MNKIGLFYITGAIKTSNIARCIKEAFGRKVKIDIISVECVSHNNFDEYDNLIIGTSTWSDGTLPVFWDEIINDIEKIDLSGKKVAIFGLGDQVNYPDNFVDGIGILAEAFESTGAVIVGRTSPQGYTFNRSLALNDNMFDGLAIDIENQSELTKQRIYDWVELLQNEFN